MKRQPPRSTRTDTLFPYTTLVRSDREPVAPRRVDFTVHLQIGNRSGSDDEDRPVFTPMRTQMGDFRIRCDRDTREGPLIGSQLTRLAGPRKSGQAKTKTDSADSILRQTSLVQRLPRNAKRQLL